MDVQAYTIAIACMGVLSGTAALAAIVLTIRQLSRPRRPKKSRRALIFDLPPDDLRPPKLRPLPEPDLTPFPAETPDLSPILAPTPPTPSPAPSLPPPPQPAPRLDMALMSARAPTRLKVPVDLARGRILELSLPLWLSSGDGCDLRNLKVQIVLPNEITYGASLDRLSRETVPALPGAKTSYTSAESHTLIEIDIPLLAGGTEALIPIPISIKHAAAVAYPIMAMVSCEELDPVKRRYELELSSPGGEEIEDGESWTCRPDESARTRDPHLPLDRIASTRFVIHEGRAAAAERDEAEVASLV